MIYLAAAQLFLSASAAAATATPTSLLVEDCSFGEAYAFTRVECQVTLTNQGDKPVRISDIASQDDLDDIKPGSATVAPHAKAYLTASVATGNGLGNVRHVFRFRSDEPGHEKRTAVARGFVTSILDQGRAALDFGVVDASTEPPSKRVDLTSHDVANFRIEKIVSAPAYLDVKLDADGRSLEAALRRDAPWGFRVDYVKLKTNTSLQPEVWIGVQADIHGDVVASGNPFGMGMMRTGNRNEQLIRLAERNGRSFTTGAATIEGFKGTASVEPCNPEREGCKLVKLVFSDDQALGTIKGAINVDFPDYRQSMRIAVWGLLVDKDTKIETLDAEKLAAAKSASSADGSALDVKSAITNAVAAAGEPEPAGRGPVLKWTVANELLIHGYQVFRGDSESGEFLLLNRESIAKKSKGNESASYKWRDTSAVPGHTYWYYVGIVYNDGHKQQLTGPQKAVAR